MEHLGRIYGFMFVEDDLRGVRSDDQATATLIINRRGEILKDRYGAVAAFRSKFPEGPVRVTTTGYIDHPNRPSASPVERNTDSLVMGMTSGLTGAQIKPDPSPVEASLAAGGATVSAQRDGETCKQTADRLLANRTPDYSGLNAEDVLTEMLGLMREHSEGVARQADLMRRSSALMRRQHVLLMEAGR